MRQPHRASCSSTRLWPALKLSFGAGSVIAARYDLDERGVAVVDVLVVPVRDMQHGRSKTPVPTVSVNRSLDDLAASAERHRRAALSVLQDRWAEHAAEHVDPRLVRGRPRIETQAEHLRPAALRQHYEQEERRLAAELEAAKRATAEAEKKRLAAEADRQAAEARRDDTLAELDEARREIRGWRRLIAEWRTFAAAQKRRFFGAAPEPPGEPEARHFDDGQDEGPGGP